MLSDELAEQPAENIEIIKKVKNFKLALAYLTSRVMLIM